MKTSSRIASIIVSLILMFSFSFAVAENATNTTTTTTVSTTTSTTSTTTASSTTTTAPQANATTTTQPTQTTTTLPQCSTTSDSVCPSGCAAGSDYDCCKNAGKYWITGRGCYNSPSYGTGSCTASSNCSTSIDNCCPQWCAAGSDADCTAGSGGGGGGGTINTTTTTQPSAGGGGSNASITTTTTATPTTVLVCAQDAKQCPDGKYVSRNPYNKCEFYDCPSTKTSMPPVITQFEISNKQVKLHDTVNWKCVAYGESSKLRNIELIVFTPSGKTETFGLHTGTTPIVTDNFDDSFIANEEGVNSAYCRATDIYGNVAKRGPVTFSVHSGPEIRQACQVECCVFEEKFEDKFCDTGLKCENRKCVKIEKQQEWMKDIQGITRVNNILESPAKFNDAMVRIAGFVEKGKCNKAGDEVVYSTTAKPAKTAQAVKAEAATARDIVTGRATAATNVKAVQVTTQPVANKCFPFYISDGSGSLGLMGFGGDTNNKKIELKGIVKTYESSGKIIPFLKVEGRSDVEEIKKPLPVEQASPFYTNPENDKQECFKLILKYAIRLKYNKDAKNAAKADELWNYLDTNHQDTISKIAAVCKEEPEMSTEQLSRAIESELSKETSYGSAMSMTQTTPTTQPSVIPLVIVTRDISNAQIEELRKAAGTAFSGPLPVEVINKLTIIRMPAIKDSIESIKKLPFVEDVKVDSVNMAVHQNVNRSYEQKELRTLEIPKDELLKKLEVIKSLTPSENDQVLLSEGQDSIIQSSDSLGIFENETKQRGVGYGLSWFIGFAAEQENKDANFLNVQSEQLANTIKTLETVANSTEDITIKSNMNEQIAILKKQADGLKREAETKSKNSGGLLSLLKNLLGGSK